MTPFIDPNNTISQADKQPIKTLGSIIIVPFYTILKRYICKFLAYTRVVYKESIIVIV